MPRALSLRILQELAEALLLSRSRFPRGSKRTKTLDESGIGIFIDQQVAVTRHSSAIVPNEGSFQAARPRKLSGDCVVFFLLQSNFEQCFPDQLMFRVATDYSRTLYILESARRKCSRGVTCVRTLIGQTLSMYAFVAYGANVFASAKSCFAECLGRMYLFTVNVNDAGKKVLASVTFKSYASVVPTVKAFLFINGRNNCCFWERKIVFLKCLSTCLHLECLI